MPRRAPVHPHRAKPTSASFAVPSRDSSTLRDLTAKVGSGEGSSEPVAWRCTVSQTACSPRQLGTRQHVTVKMHVLRCVKEVEGEGHVEGHAPAALVPSKSSGAPLVALAIAPPQVAPLHKLLPMRGRCWGLMSRHRRSLFASTRHAGRCLRELASPTCWTVLPAVQSAHPLRQYPQDHPFLPRFPPIMLPHSIPSRLMPLPCSAVHLPPSPRCLPYLHHPPIPFA